MKLLIIKSILLVILSSVFFACNHSKKEKDENEEIFAENPIKWDTIRTKTATPFMHDTLNAEYIISIDYIYPHHYMNETANEKLGDKLNKILWGVDKTNFLPETSPGEQAVIVFAESQAGKYLAEMQKNMESWNGINGDSLFNAVENFGSHILYNKANIVSYQLIQDLSNGRGGSVPRKKVTNLTFDLKKGVKINESDLFIENYRDSLNSILSREASNFIERTYKDKSNKNISKEFWGTKDIGSNQNFYITQDSIIYDFNPLEYSSEKLGIIHIPLSYGQLEHIIRKDGPLGIFLLNQEDNNK